MRALLAFVRRARVLRARLLRHARAAFLVHAPHLFARCCTPDSRELGLLGEEIAARALRRGGCVLEGRRVRTPHAEVDLVAREARELVCVEVKTAWVVPLPRRRGAGEGERFETSPYHRDGRLGRVQQARLERAARFLARGRPLRPRVDLVEVRLHPTDRRLAWVHVRDVGRTRKEVPGWVSPLSAGHD